MSEPFKLETNLAFDKDKQAAIFAWAMRDKKFCEACNTVVKGDWFTSPYIRLLYNAFMELYESEHRLVAPLELLKHPGLGKKEKADRDNLKAALEHAFRQSEIYHVSLLRKEMNAWMKAVVFFQAFEKAQRAYNAQKVDEAIVIVNDAMLMLATTSFEDGTNVGFVESSERILDEERDERLAEAPKLLDPGISYLRDTLGGIMCKDLWLIGAKSGHGKTQLATSIAKSVAMNGGKPHYFALEAEKYEIERRIKFGILSDSYKRWCQREGEKRERVCYTDWRQGRLEKVLGKFEKDEEVRHNLAESVRNMKTYYRDSGIFDMRVLEKNILKIVDETSLIVVDHLHYIDTDERTENENREYKKIVKLIRDIVLKRSVPVALVAHLRKSVGSRSNPPLISCLDDFHGSSDVPKVSTTAIMIAPAYGVTPPEIMPHVWPTYMGVEKSRLEGGRTRFTGITYFDPDLNLYSDIYRIGKMGPMKTEWEEETDIPWWAKNADRSGRDL